MTTSTLPPVYRSPRRPGRDGFAQLLHAEWTKFRTVRGWGIALIGAAILAALATVAITTTANGKQNQGAHNPGPVGPGGVAVTDEFTFVHQSLDGNGSITARITSLTGKLSPPFIGFPQSALDQSGPGLQPWSKAGIIIKASLKSGSAYAAVMASGGHGIRMQYDYTHDLAGQSGLPSASAPAWLRLTRSGDTVTGYDSTDGSHWTQIGTATLPGLPATVQAGLLATSPPLFVSQQAFANNDVEPLDSLATGTFDHVTREGNWAANSWTGTQVGEAGLVATESPCGHTNCAKKGFNILSAVGYRASGGTYRLTGTGDIAPYVPTIDPLGVSFKGTLVGLIAVIALGALFITAEYRRGMMIRTTLVASPRRGRVLAAKAVVIGSVTFVAGLAGAAVALVLAVSRLNANGWVSSVFPVWKLLSAHGLQMVVGTAGLFALAAILAVAAGATLRRSAGAIAAVIGVMVVPLILATVLPASDGDWLLRLTPAAAFAVQRGTPSYSQVNQPCMPYNGCYPLSPWHGFAVLAIWAALALGGAILLLRRRDA
jgi:hypothetical protein